MNGRDIMDVQTWHCIRCNRDFVDPDEVPEAIHFRNQDIVERKDHWLGIEPICTECAVAAGIPSIDEE